MTDKNLSELIIILDRSGSMASIRADMEGGFKTFIRDRHRDATDVRVSLYQFDDVYETVYERRPARDIERLHLEPRGSTALFDAIARTITTVGRRLSATPEEQRPGALVVMIITDGMENASREYARDLGGAQRVRQMIEHQEQKYAWKFLYLGADPAAFEEAAAIGINPLRSAKYSADHLGTHALFEASSNGIGEYFSAQSMGVIGADLNLQGQEGLEVGTGADVKQPEPVIKIDSSTGK